MGVSRVAPGAGPNSLPRLDPRCLVSTDTDHNRLPLYNEGTKDPALVSPISSFVACRNPHAGTRQHACLMARRSLPPMVVALTDWHSGPCTPQAPPVR